MKDAQKIVVLTGIEEVEMLNERVNTIYAIKYDGDGEEKRTEIGSATSKGVAWLFANSVLHIYKALRIVYHDGSSVLIGQKSNG